jgi:hypothetical protein
MAPRRTAVATKRSATGRKTTKTKAAARRATGRRKAARPTLASVTAQISALSEQVEQLTQLVGKLAMSRASARVTKAPTANRSRVASQEKLGSAEGSNGAHPPVDMAAFDSDLLELLGQLDRRGRHGGLVPIPDVRAAFLRRGWTRRAFDQRLLQAERDFVIDLKTANDPGRLAEPELAIEEPGRGHLQYVVLR